MANPQPKPFVQFSKELFDALLLSQMPAGHKEIVLAVIRRTYGDHGKKRAPMSLSLLSSITGRGESGIRKAIVSLKTEGVLNEVTPAGFRTAAVYALNKDYEKWGAFSVLCCVVAPESPTGADRPENVEGTAGTECSHGAECPAGQSVPQGQSAPGEALESAPAARGTVLPQDTIEDIGDVETKHSSLRGAYTPGEESDTDPTEVEDRPPTADKIVAFAVNRARETGVALTKAQTGHLACEIGRQFKAGADPLLIGRAVGVLVDENKSPDKLGYVMRDLQKGGDRVGTHSGRSQNGEW